MGRSDGVKVRGLPKYRRIMPHFMRTKQESIIYYESLIRAEKIMDFCERMTEEYKTNVTPFHLILHALLKTHVAYPRVNRFVKAGVIWQRKGIYFSFSIKKQMKTTSPISVVKRRFEPSFTLKDTVKTARKEIKEGRDMKKKDQAEKEASNYLWIPAPIIRMLYPAYKFLDEWGLLPASIIEKDPLYASAFIANIGAFNADTAYHHLYELGTIPVFLIVGRIKEMPVVENGRVVPALILPIKMTYDERIEDGFYYNRALSYFKDQLENPEKLLEPAELKEK